MKILPSTTICPPLVPTVHFNNLNVGDTFRLAAGHRVLIRTFDLNGNPDNPNATYLHSGSVSSIAPFASVVRVKGNFVVDNSDVPNHPPSTFKE